MGYIRVLLLVTFYFLTDFASAHSELKDSLVKKVMIPELKMNINKDGSNYIKATFLGQTWLRYSEMNSGTTIDGNPISSYADLGIRRWRFQAFGQLTDRIFFHTQFGQNNITTLQAKHTGAFIHDAVTELKIVKELHIGGGLTGWNGMSRYSAASVGNALGLDVPLYQQALTGVDDQFSRKLALYAKGDISKLNYRVAIARPMSIRNSLVPIPPINEMSNFSLETPKIQHAGYFFWQFFDHEVTSVPYMTGTYLGKKKVLNLGGGWTHQANAMWRTNEIGDTVRSQLLLLNVDLYLDLPVGKKGAAFSAYVALSKYDYGKNYLRNANGMNPANGIQATQASINGAGIAYPMMGTGSILYSQLGYKLKDDLFKGNGSLLPYVDVQMSKFQVLHNYAVTFGGGINWLIHGGHGAKLTLAYQNRPEFMANDLQLNVQRIRRNMLVLQYQIAI